MSHGDDSGATCLWLLEASSAVLLMNPESRQRKAEDCHRCSRAPFSMKDYSTESCASSPSNSSFYSALLIPLLIALSNSCFSLTVALKWFPLSISAPSNIGYARHDTDNRTLARGEGGKTSKPTAKDTRNYGREKKGRINRSMGLHESSAKAVDNNTEPRPPARPPLHSKKNNKSRPRWAALVTMSLSGRPMMSPRALEVWAVSALWRDFPGGARSQVRLAFPGLRRSWSRWYFPRTLLLAVVDKYYCFDGVVGNGG